MCNDNIAIKPSVKLLYLNKTIQPDYATYCTTIFCSHL